ncbi:MAG TPA: hypothetical protein VFE93_17395, partial [Myxococcaceae bacterium]|nr:hypothetical protein [Myxococcaceae bacterium]
MRSARLLVLLWAAPSLAQAPTPSRAAAPSTTTPSAASVEALGIRWSFSGELVINANFNSATMVVGSIPGFV